MGWVRLLGVGCQASKGWTDGRVVLTNPISVFYRFKVRCSIPEVSEFTVGARAGCSCRIPVLSREKPAVGVACRSVSCRFAASTLTYAKVFAVSRARRGIQSCIPVPRRHHPYRLPIAGRS